MTDCGLIFFQCYTLQQRLLDVGSQLEKCQEESSRKDETIRQLTQKVQKLESEIEEIKDSTQEKVLKRKKNLFAKV